MYKKKLFLEFFTINKGKLLEKYKMDKHNFEIIKILSDCKKGIRNKIIRRADDSLIVNLCECVINTLNGNINQSDSKLYQLKKYKKTLRKIVKLKKLKSKKEKYFYKKEDFYKFYYLQLYR